MHMDAAVRRLTHRGTHRLPDRLIARPPTRPDVAEAPLGMHARPEHTDAAADLALEGAAGVGIDAIAARAGVSRTTVYKWWSSAATVLLEGLLERTHDTLESPAAATDRAYNDGSLA